MLKKLLKKIITEIKKLFTEEVHYINGPETLPPPLTKEEELKIMEQIINGNEKAREPLITHNLRLVVYIAKNSIVQELMLKILFLLEPSV